MLEIYEEMAMFILDVCGIYIYFQFVKVFFDRQKAKNSTLMFLFFLWNLVSIMMIQFANMPILTLTVNVGCLFLITCLYEATFRQRVASVVLIIMMHLFGETLVVILYGLTEVSVFRENQDVTYSISSYAAVRLICFMIMLLIRNFRDLRKGRNTPWPYWVGVVFIPLMTTYMMIIMYQKESLEANELTLLCLGLLFVNIFVFSYYDQILGKEKLTGHNQIVVQENQMYAHQLEKMKMDGHSHRAFRHDLKNHMSTLQAFAEMGDNTRMNQYLTTLTQKQGQSLQYANSGNMVVDSILNYKLERAEKENIQHTLQMRIPDDIEVESYDMTVILGNLLDNAIHAAALVAKQERKLDIAIHYNHNQFTASIGNTYNGVLKKENEKLLTTHQDKKNHGLGIQNVKEMVGKYQGILDIQYSDSYFHVTVALLLHSM